VASSRNPSANLEELLESLAFLLEELPILAGLCFSGLEEIMADLTTGRSPQSLKLGERLESPLALSDSFSAAREEGRALLEEFLKLPVAQSLPEELETWKAELDSWREWQEQVSALLKKLQLLSDQGQLTALGRMPLEDLWEEIQSLA